MLSSVNAHFLDEVLQLDYVHTPSLEYEHNRVNGWLESEWTRLQWGIEEYEERCRIEDCRGF